MRLAWRFFLRDWRAGELAILFLALLVAVASVSSVGLFADRVKQALERNAHQLLGGDLLVDGDQPLPADFRAEASARGLLVAEAATFLSMARAQDGARLASVKAVDAGYPLRGRLGVVTDASAAATSGQVAHGPPRGAVWVEPRYADQAGVKVGDWLELGDARLRIAALLTQEPDRGLGFFNLAPRVMLHLDDLAVTGLVQPGSRIRYQLYLAGGSEAVAGYRAWLLPRLGRGQKAQGLEDARPEIRAGLERARSFLGLAALLAVILAAVAVLLATRRYVERHYDGYAVMRCLGARQRRLAGLFGGQFLLLGGMAGLGGVLLGYAAQYAIAGVLAGFLPGGALDADLPPPSLRPAGQGLATGYALLLGFALPPLLRLKTVPALRVLRRELGRAGEGPWLADVLGLAVLIGLLVWQAGELRLAAYALGGFLAATAVFAATAILALRLFAHAGFRLAPRRQFAWRQGLANLRRRVGTNTLQTVSLALGLTALLLLSFTQSDLLSAWRAETPPDAPNRFIVNIQPGQQAAILDLFRSEGLATPDLYPMVRGRLLAINDRPVDPDDYSDDRARRLVEREFNLSHMALLPGHNRVVAGGWFGPEELTHGALSVEQGIAETLGIELGDRLAWSVAGETFTASVTSLRQLNWDSMQVNFFVIATPGLLADMPASYITSFRLPAGGEKAMARLVRAFPNLTVVDTSAILEQALGMMERMSRAVRFVFLFALAAGLLVLYTALLATRDERGREAALLRALGASRAQVAGAQRVETLAMGFLAGFLAAAGSSAVGALLAIRVFGLDYSPDPWVWVAGPALGLLCVAINTWLGVRAAVGAGPLGVLRES